MPHNLLINKCVIFMIHNDSSWHHILRTHVRGEGVSSQMRTLMAQCTLRKLPIRACFSTLRASVQKLEITIPTKLLNSVRKDLVLSNAPLILSLLLKLYEWQWFSQRYVNYVREMRNLFCFYFSWELCEVCCMMSLNYWFIYGQLNFSWKEDDSLSLT